jgi:alanine-glyoxylate transaminase/serine-glyoxylate transaminase/serine-pyruvate transaminase
MSPTPAKTACPIDPCGAALYLSRVHEKEPAMSLAQGRHYLAIPGPSVMPDRVLQTMHRPAPNIYTGELVEMTASLVPDLKAVARTAHNVAMYIANGHGAWEAALVNTLSRGDRILVLGTGRFCLGWGEMAAALGVACEVIDFGPQSDIAMERVAEALAADTGHSIKAVLAVQVDTATSVKNDIAALRATLDTAGHPALLFSDNIACLACDAFHMDDWGVDVMVTGSQKGLMTPPGMGFVFFNDRADRARETADLVTPYWDWRPRIDPQEYYKYFNGTAPTHHLYGLRTALDMIAEEGLDAVWRRHAILAQAIWAALEVWGQAGPVRPNIAEREKRSHAVTTVNFGPGNGQRLRDWMQTEAGVTLGIPLAGLAGDPADYLRIGHMGHVNAHMVLGVLASLQAGMAALQIPHGPTGLEAAVKVIAEA